MGITAKSRTLVLDEEVDRKSGVTEALGKKWAGISNFLMQDMLVRDDFKMNGAYSVGSGSIGVDGILIFPVKVEIVLIAMSNQKAGASGISELDIHWFNGPGSDQGTIFTTKPSIDFNAPDDAYSLTEILTPTDIVTGTGIVNPRVNKSTFEQGEAIRMDMDDTMANPAQDCMLSIYYRPIT